MIGLKFEIKNEYNKFLSMIFSNINCSHFVWNVKGEVFGEKGNLFFQ